MYLLSRSIPLIIALPAEEEASQGFLKEQLYADEATYHEAFIIADRLAKIPAIEASGTSFLAAVSVSDVIISHNQTELEQWVDQFSEGNIYWFFSLRHGEAIPIKRKGIQTLDSPPCTPSRQIARFFDSLPQEQKGNAEAQGKPTAKAYYLTSLRQLFHRVKLDNIKETINDFMAEVQEDSFYFDPEQREALAKALRTNNKAESAE
jgi:hypothetical protein